MEAFLSGFHTPHWLGWGISCLDKTQEPPKILISLYKASKRHLNIWNYLTRKNAAGLRQSKDTHLIAPFDGNKHVIPGFTPNFGRTQLVPISSVFVNCFHAVQS